jgi:hypothetical protein
MNNEARVQVEGFFGQAVVEDDDRGLDSAGKQAQWLNPGKRGRTLVLTCHPPFSASTHIRVYIKRVCVCIRFLSLIKYVLGVCV